MTSESEITTDGDGNATESVELPAGAYKAVFETTDPGSQKVSAETPILVVDTSSDIFAVKIPNHFDAKTWTVEPGEDFVALWGTGYETGQALFENTVYDADSGQLLSGSFLDYCIPRATDLPPMSVQTIDATTPTNPLGAKGCGEAGTIGSTPAVANAVIDALAPFGVTHMEMPLKPEKVWKAMQGQGS